MNYPGGKNGAGVYQKIISMMPPHEIYIELFLGSGSILRNKRTSKQNIGIELDQTAFEAFRSNFYSDSFSLLNRNALEFIDTQISSYPTDIQRKTLIYADPPYLQSTRKSKGKIYRSEMLSEAEHAGLLRRLIKLDCKIMISGYQSDLYDSILVNWRKEAFNTTNRAGQRTTEIIWMNFEKPLQLHDYSFLGEDFRERERIKRKRQRWKRRLERMDSHERFALMATIEELSHGSARHF